LLVLVVVVEEVCERRWWVCFRSAATVSTGLLGRPAGYSLSVNSQL